MLAGSGKIYGMPYNTNRVLIIDPTTDTADIVTMSPA